MAYLDDTGLAYFWGKIKAYVAALLAPKANDSDVVHKTGNESVSGTKTFSSQIVGAIGKSVGDGDYAAMVQTYQSDNGGNRSCTVRCTNGDGFNEIIVGAHDESNGSPAGISVRNTDGVLTSTFGGSLRLTSTNDVLAESDNNPPLVIGAVSGRHLEFDDNEIMSKAGVSGVNSLYLNRDGGDVFLGGYDVNHKSVTGRGKGSSTVPVYTDADGIVTACGSSLAVGITGNAATATKLATARTINGVSFDGSANITVEDSTKVSKSGDTMTGALSARASNVNISVEPSSLKEDYRFLITKSTADTTHTGNLLRFGAAQNAGSKDYRILLGVSNPRAGKLPTQESIARGDDDSDASTGNCWGSIGVWYDYSKNRAYPCCFGLSTYGLSDDSTECLATNYWVRHATGNFACNAATATKLATARNLKVKLDSTTAVTFDGSANQNAIPVTGILPVSSGGTGSSSKNFVDLSTDQTIAGRKRFSDVTVFGTTNNTYEHLYISSVTNGVRLAAQNFGVSSRGAGLELRGRSAPADAGHFTIFATNTTSSKDLVGKPDGTLTWNGQSIQTSSDERVKTSLSEVPDAVLDAWEEVDWGQFQYLDAVKEKGEAARLHLGLIAQHVMSVFEKHGLDACAYGILCHEEHEATEDSEAADLWMVRYAEAQRLAALELRLGSE